MKNPATPVIDRSTTSVVWLDLDDTLIDFQANSLRALEKVYYSENLSRYFASPQEWKDRYRYYNQKLWKEYATGQTDRSTLKMERFRLPLVEAGESRDNATGISVRLDKVYLDLLAQEKQLVPGAMELLGRIREAGLTIGILSNGFVEVQHRKIASAGLTGKIDIIVLSDDIGVNKPDVRLYEHAMKVSGVTDSSRHIMIGDNPDTDIAGALAAGWKAIHFCPDSAGVPSQNCCSVDKLDLITIK